MTWTCSSCDDLDTLAAEPIRPHPLGRPKNHLKRERLERVAAAMRAANAGNERKRQAAKAAIARKRREA